ncbi:MAG: hypothetical protein ACFFC7_30130 [Candidatus Hermodarchaeota archaeon]
MIAWEYLVKSKQYGCNSRSCRYNKKGVCRHPSPDVDDFGIEGETDEHGNPAEFMCEDYEER